MVATEHLHNVGHLAQYLYEETYKNRGLISREIRFFVVAPQGEGDPSEEEELAAPSTSSQLSIRLPLKSLKHESYLLAVVDSLLPDHGKRRDARHAHSQIPPPLSVAACRPFASCNSATPFPLKNQLSSSEVSNFYDLLAFPCNQPCAGVK